MSDSEEDYRPTAPSAPRVKRFRFKTFAERVKEVEVDVYRSRAAVKAEPNSGSWLADALTQWRELNSASHFLQAAAEVQNLCQTLPQLLHHRETVARILLGALEPAARLSLPALLALTTAFARDLQQEFVPLLPRLVRRLVALLDGGAEREPESLEAVFTAVSAIFKHLVRHLAADLPAALRLSAPLRYHGADYVRQFAAQAVGFLLRAAPTPAALRAGVRCVLAEQAARPSPERTDGAGLVLAEAILSVNHGLHSRAPQVLQLLLKEDLLQPSDLRPAGAAPSAPATAADAATGKQKKKSAAAAAAPAPDAAVEAGRQLPVTQEQLRARAAAVARVALARLLTHLRRGRGAELWQALLAETAARHKTFESLAAAGAAAGPGAAGAQLSPAAAAAGRSLGRCLTLVADAVDYFRGSRVESYGPILELLGRLMHPPTWLPTSLAASAAVSAAGAAGADQASPGSVSGSGLASASPSPTPSPRPSTGGLAAGGPGRGAEREGEEEGEEEEGDGVGSLYNVSLSACVLELVRGVIYGHLKTVGASEGLAALGGRCAGAAWAPCFSRPPAAEALPFIKALMVWPAGADVARAFGPQMMGCLGRLVMAAGAGAGTHNSAASNGDGHRHRHGHANGQQQQEEGGDADFYRGAALLLLRDLCQLLQPYGSGGAAPSGLPLLLTAQPHGVKLAAHVRAMALEWQPPAAAAAAATAAGQEGAAERRRQAAAWAALSLLPHACESTAQAVSACEHVLQAATAALQKLSPAAAAAAAAHSADGGAGDAGGLSGLLLLRATATEMLCDLLQRQQAATAGGAGSAAASGLSSGLVSAAEAALQWVLDCCGEPAVAGAAAASAVAAAEAGDNSKDKDARRAQRRQEHAQQRQEAAVSGGADFASIRAAGTLLGAVRAALDAATAAAAASAPYMGSGAALSAARALLATSRLQAVLPRLAPLLAAESLPQRAAVLRLLCCFEQPQLTALGADPTDPTSSTPSSTAKREAAAAAAPRCDLLEVLHAINSQPPSIESGRRWNVALGRLRTYLEYGRIPEFLVPALVYGCVGLLYIRFSPLWGPASEALAVALQHRAKVAWPIVFAYLGSSQQQLLSGDFPHAAASARAHGNDRGGGKGGRRRSFASVSAAVHSEPVVQERPVAQDASIVEALEDRYHNAAVAGTPEAAGGVTDPQNRLSHVLRAMAKAPHDIIEQFSRDWAPLVIEYTAARGSHFDDGEGDVEAAVAAARAAAAAAAHAAAAAAIAEKAAVERPAKKARRGGEAEAEDPAVAERRNSHAAASTSADAAATPVRGRGKGKKGAAAADAAAASTPTAATAPTTAPTTTTAAPATAVSSTVSVLSRIGGKTWRAGLLDWLKLLAGLKGVRGLHRCEELQRAVASHLLEPDAAVQGAALRCLRPWRLRWLPVEMADRLARLVDDGTLREELAVFPLAPDADQGVGEEARPGLVPLLVRLLFPKMRKRSGRLGGRGAPGSARAAILNFLASLRPAELRPLLELLLEPMAIAFVEPPTAVAAAAAPRPGGAAVEAEAAEVDRFRLLPPPRWSAAMLGRGVGWWLAAVDQAALDALPPRRKIGFLNAFEDLLTHLGHGVEPFLPTLTAITLRLLATATAAVSADQAAAAAEAEAEVAAEEAERAAKAASKKGPGRGRPGAAGAGAPAATAGAQAEADAEAEGDAMQTDGGGAAAAGGKDAQHKKLKSKKADNIAADGDQQDPGAAEGEDADEDEDDDEDEEVKAAARAPAERHREVRSAALRLLAQVWLRFPASPVLDLNEVWPVFLPAVQPLLGRLQFEAAASKEPPLLECVLSLSLSPGLARVLGDLPSVPDASLSLVRPAGSSAATAAALAAAARGEASAVEASAEADAAAEAALAAMEAAAGPKAEWQLRGQGSALVKAVVGMLCLPRCTEIVRATVLDVLDSVLGCGEALLRRVLLPWLADVLTALHTAIAQSWEGGGGGGGGAAAGRNRNRRRPPTATAHRELGILERLGGFVADPRLASRLADSLVALLAQAGARSLRQRSSSKKAAAGRLDEGGVSRALGAMAALWRKLTPGQLDTAAIERYCESMSMWAIRLNTRDARASLAAAYGAVAALLPALGPTAALLAELTSWSAASLDEVDYDRRMAAYSKLTPEAWSGMGRLQALPLALAALHDLRNATDLALRQAAATSLSALITTLAELDAAAPPPAAAAAAAPAAAAAAAAAAADADEEADAPDSLLRLIGRVLFPQLKTQLGHPSLAVRQEHLALLRHLAEALPRRFPDLAALLSADPETDFFNNVAHLQSHRRVRALAKLTKLIRQQIDASASSSSSSSSSSAAAAASSEAPDRPLLGRVLMDVVVPLLQQFIQEAAGLGGADVSRAHDKKQTDLDKEANVTDAAVGALGAVAALLRWPQYEQLLNQFMRMMKGRPAKPLIRAVCAIIDNFHFALPASDEEGGAAAAAAEGPHQPAALAAAKRPHGDAEADADDEEEDDEAAAADAAAAAADAEAEARAVQRSLLVRILPALHEQLVDKGRRGEDEELNQSVRAPVALALVKLLKLLPPAAERAELPRALQGVTNLLRARLQRIRDDARAVLVSMMAELGPRYLPYACHVLRASLPDRGFTAHVIGFTLHSVLEAVVGVAMRGQSAAAAAAAAVAAAEKDEEEGDGAGGKGGPKAGYDVEEVGEGEEAPEEVGGAAAVAAAADAAAVEEPEPEGPVGVLDESLELCLPLIEADLFGHVSEAKEVANFANQYKEAKRCRANDAYQLLATGITFGTHMRILLSTVTSKLAYAGQPGMRAKLTLLLQYAARGVRVNPTAGPKQIMALCVGLMEGCLTREEAARARAKAAVGAAGSGAAGLAPAAAAIVAAAAKSESEADRAALHETLVLEFCLTLLHSAVRRGVLAGARRSPELLQLLDPALPLLVRALRSRHAGCVSLALRTLSAVVGLPLPSMAEAAPEAGRALSALLKKVPNTRHPIAQDCFRLLAALLRDCAAYSPTTAQLRFLLRWAFEDLGEAGSQPTSFALLRALLGRRVVLPEVYDVMERVQQIMVRSQSAAVRSCCGAALLAFLLDFPLGPARLKAHVGFLLANLEYEYESGRLAALDMLGQVVAKFPSEVLQAQSDLLLMPLVVRLVNDSSSKARAASGDVLRSLLSRLEPPQLDRAFAYCRAWLERGGGQGGGATDASLRRAAAQTLGFLAEAEGGRFGRRLGEVAPALLRVLQRQAAASEGADDDAGPSLDDESAASDTACPGWQEAYYGLLLLEKVAAAPGAGSAALAWPAPGAAAVAGPLELAPDLWRTTCRLLLHRHMWVRKAAARLVGHGLASPRVSGGLLAPRTAPGGAAAKAAAAAAAKAAVGAKAALPREPSPAGELAFAFFLQLECDAADEATCLQAVKCLVSLAVRLQAEAEAAGGAGGAANGVANGAKKAKTANGTANAAVAGAEEEVGEGEEDEDEEAEDDEQQQDEEEEQAEAEAAAAAEDDVADDDGDDASMADQVSTRAFTLRGLVRRIARLADDARWHRVRQRAAALRWTAAAASALGPAAIGPHLPVLLRPLYRISEAVATKAAIAGSMSTAAAAAAAATGSRLPDEIRALSEEVMAHLRGLVGSEALLSAYNAAREHVRSARSERKRRSAVRGAVDPAAAAAARLRHGERKTEGRKRKMEMMKRERGAGGGRGGRRGRGGAGGFKRPRG